MKRLFAAMTVAAFGSASAGAAEPQIDRSNGFFFNRSAATVDQMTGDIVRCRATAEGADSQITSVGVLAGGVGSIIGGAFAGKRLKRVNIENCMLIRDWRLYAMTREEGAVWKALPQDRQDAELAILVGAAVPGRGSLLREWRNDYAEPVLWQKD